MTKEESVNRAKSNIAYFAGYYDSTTRTRVEQFYNCEHPYFGSIAKNGQPSPKESFEIGLKLGENIKRQKKYKDMSIKHKKEFGVYHWDTFDNEIILIFEDNSLAKTEKFVKERYKDRIKDNGADQVDIVNKQGNIIKKYKIV